MARDLYGDMLSRALQRQAPSGHFPAYITPFEAGLLRSRGGGVPPGGGQYMAGGIPAFFSSADDPGGGAEGGASAGADMGDPEGTGVGIGDPDAGEDPGGIDAAIAQEAHAAEVAAAAAEAQGSSVDPISGRPSPTTAHAVNMANQAALEAANEAMHRSSNPRGAHNDPNLVQLNLNPEAYADPNQPEAGGLSAPRGYTSFDIPTPEIAALSHAVTAAQEEQDQQGFLENLFTFTVPQGYVDPVTGQPSVVDSVNVPAVVGTMLGTVLGIPGLGLAGQALGESMMGQMVDTSPTPDFGDTDTEDIGGPSDQELESIERVRREEEERERKEEEAAEEAAQSSFDPPIIDTSTIDEATRQRILANVLSGLQRIERPTEGVTAFGPAFV